MRPDPFTDLVVMLGGLLAPFIFFVWLAYVISATRSLRKIRIEAQKQTELLEQIAKQTRPPVDPAKPPAVATGYESLREKKSSAGTALVVLLIMVAVGVIIALTRN